MRFDSVTRTFLRRTKRGLVWSAFFFGLTTSCAWAEEPGLYATISEIGVWDTNPLMLTQGAQTLYGSTTTPSLSYKAETPTRLIEATGRLDVNQFTDTAFNSNDAHAALNLLKRNQRWQAGLAGTVDHDTTRTNEITNFGLNTGIVKRSAYSFSPSVFFTPTALDKLSLTGSAERIMYDKDSYTDYSVFTVTPQYARQLTPQTSALFSLQTQRYQSGGDYKIRLDSVSPMTGFAFSPTPVLTFNVQGGMQTSRQTNAFLTDDSWRWNYIYSGAATYKSKADSVSLRASRARQSYGNGYNSLITNLGLDDRHDITRRLSFTVGGGYQFASQAQSGGNNMDAQTNSQTGFVYHVTETLDFNLNYQYRTESFVNTDRTAEENLARVGLSFRPLESL